MTKPVIVKREVKGTPLTYTELDTNFQNLKDATINFSGDLGDTRSMDLNDVTSITGDPDHNIKVTVDEATQSIVIDNTLGDYTKEPMGFENRTDSTISFNNSTRVFTIAPTSSSYRVWVSGKEFIKSSSLTVTIPNTTGLYYIYFDSTGTLGYQTDYFYWQTEAPCAYVYWNASTGTSYYFADERHGIALDWATHEYLHRTRGAAFANGFVISNYTTLGSGSLDADAQIDLAGGVFFDEDLKIQITHSSTPSADYEQDLQGPARIPVIYRSGVGGLWVKDSATDFPLKQGTAYPKYNLNTAGTWTTPDTGNNKYWVMWVVATHHMAEPVMAIMGQREDVNQGTANDENTWEALDLDNFPSQEFRPLYRLMFQSGGANTPHCALKAVLDYRQGEIREAAAVGTTTGLGEVVEDTSPQLGGNLDVNGFSIVSTSNGDITLAPNGTGNINLSTDTVRVGENIGLSGYNVIESYPDSRLLLRSYDTSDQGSIMYFTPGVDSSINLGVNGAGTVFLSSPKISVGNFSSNAEITSGGSYNLTISTNSSINSGIINIAAGVNGNITLDPHGTGQIKLDGPLTIAATTGTPTTFENGYYEDMLQTPVSWLKISIGGSTYYLPLFQ
jgi:hypothetical protein